jgi:hypothetical protein
LYAADPQARTYADVDIIVAPKQLSRARNVLLELGFARYGVDMLAVDEPHARHFQRAADGAAVDLHRSLHATEHLASERVWRAISTDTETIVVADVEVEIPSVAVRALHLVLHVSPADGPGSKPWLDLERGLQLIDKDVWQAAARVAADLEIAGELAHRLARLPQARTLLAQLDLPHGETSLHASLRIAHSGGSVPGLMPLLRLTALPDRRSQLAYVRDKLFPPARFLLAHDKPARHRGWALSAARIAWITTRLAWLPGALRAWQRTSRRATRRSQRRGDG